MLRLEGINKEYKTKYEKIEALKNVSFELPEKGLYFVCGKSGSGKTTLLNIIGGIDVPDSGNIYYNNFLVSNMSESKLDAYRASIIGFVFQDNNLLVDYDVYKNIFIGTKLQGKKDDKAIIDSLKYVGLNGYSNRKINELSGGQKQRVAIARALAKNSKIILADEPTGSLDYETGKEIFELLKKVSQEKLVIIVTHDVESARYFGDGIISISDGLVTTEAFVTEKSEKTAEIKSKHISFLTLLAFSLKSLIKHPVRILLLIFLSSFAFSLFISAYVFGTETGYKTLQRIANYNNYIFFEPVPTMVQIAPNKYKDTINYLSKTDYEGYVSTYRKTSFYPVYECKNWCIRTASNLTDVQQEYYSDSIHGICYIDDKSIDNLKFNVIAGEAPNSNWGENDVAISKYICEIIMLCGFTASDYSDITIEDYEDIIGLTAFDGYTIRGVIDTNYDIEKFKPIKDYSLGKTDKVENKDYYDMNKNYYTSYSRYSRHGVHSMFYRHISDMPEDKSIIQVLCDNSSDSMVLIKNVYDDDNLGFVDCYSAGYYNDCKQGKDFGIRLIIVATMFAVFAGVLFAYLLSIDIKSEMHEIGILRAIGARRRDIITKYLLRNTIIGLIVFGLTLLVGTFMFIPFLQFMGSYTELPFKVYRIELNDILIMTIYLIIVIIISSLLPLIRLYLKKPREVIYS